MLLHNVFGNETIINITPDGHFNNRTMGSIFDFQLILIITETNPSSIVFGKSIVGIIALINRSEDR